MPTGDVEHLTLRDLESMPRGELLRRLEQFASFFPVPLDQGRLASLTDPSLCRLVNLARRKFQSLGY